MTITIEPSTQHTPPVDGFVQYPYAGFNTLSENTTVESTMAVGSVNFDVKANTIYLNSVAETATLLVPALRPIASAALHTVGSDFMNITASNVTKAKIKRFF